MSTNKYIRAIKREIDDPSIIGFDYAGYAYRTGYGDGLKKAIKIIRTIDKKEKS